MITRTRLKTVSKNFFHNQSKHTHTHTPYTQTNTATIGRACVNDSIYIRDTREVSSFDFKPW